MFKSAVLGVLFGAGLILGVSGIAHAGKVPLKVVNTICGVERETVVEAYTIPAGEYEDQKIAGRMIHTPERRVPAEYRYRTSCASILNDGSVLKKLTGELRTEADARQKISAVKGEASSSALRAVQGKKIDQVLTLSNIQCSCATNSAIACTGFNASDARISGVSRIQINLTRNDKSQLIVKSIVENGRTIQKSCQGVAGAIR
jgi:hypothetical protein